MIFKTMNILFLYHLTIDPIKGGIERVTNVLADYFGKRGYKIFFLGLKKSSPIIDGRQYYLPDSKRFGAKQNIQYFLYFLKANRITIVINQGGLGPQSSRLAYYCHEQNVPLISVIHNSILARINNFSSAYFNLFKKYNLIWVLKIINRLNIKIVLLWMYKQKYKKHFKELCKNSHFVVLLSDEFKKELQFFTGKKINVNTVSLPNPVSFNVKTDISQKKKELLYVGRIDFYQKRVDLLLAIWSKLYKWYADWSLHIVGDGPQLADAKQLSVKLKLENIYFDGFLEPQVYYQNASLFCMTSSYEGFGIVLVEAMQYGVIPFAFNSYLSITDIIDDQINGILIPPFNIDQYVFELERFMKDDSLRKSFAMETIKKSQKYSLDKIGGEWVSLFNNLQTDGLKL
ncbi:glycosyl transferase [Spirochaetia bacterium]|nr:glycosyl transferase [Spirochaetia bacterium]